VVRIGDPSAQTDIIEAIYLSELLRPRSVPLPAILAADIHAEFPWLLLERLPGTDLGAVISALANEQLEAIAANVVQAQAITAETGSAGRYGYAARPEQAPQTAWSQVLDTNLACSRQRIESAELFDLRLVDIMQAEVTARREEIDKIDPTPFSVRSEHPSV
jgi:hypothetical protein